MPTVIMNLYYAILFFLTVALHHFVNGVQMKITKAVPYCVESNRVEPYRDVHRANKCTDFVMFIVPTPCNKNL